MSGAATAIVTAPNSLIESGSRYYHHWLAALECLVAEKQLSDAAAMIERKEAWAEAYRHTPHGKPVELRKQI